MNRLDDVRAQLDSAQTLDPGSRLVHPSSTDLRWARYTPLQPSLAGAAALGRKAFRLLHFSEIHLPKDGNYLVKGLIPRDGLALVWGPPKSGKSFWLMDMLLHVALGRPYRARRVTGGAVVYIAAEGERGLAARIEAFRLSELGDSAPPPFFLLSTRLDLPREVRTLISDIKATLGSQICVAVAIDTLNRTIGGSENDDRDMRAFIDACGEIGRALDCVVAVVHHCGLEGSRPRGHSSLTGAVDAQIAISRDDAGVITAKLEYMKDGEAGLEMFSTLDTVQLGEDKDGDAITSLVIRPVDGVAVSHPAEGHRNLPDGARNALKLLRRAIGEAGEPLPASNHEPKGRRGVQLDLWRRYCETGGVSASDDPASRQRAFKRAGEKLQAEGFVGAWNGWVWLCDD